MFHFGPIELTKRLRIMIKNLEVEITYMEIQQID
jgi:hypothetical protein